MDISPIRQKEFEVLAEKIKKETIQKMQWDIAVRGAIVPFAQTLLTVASTFAVLRFGMNMPYREISAEEILIVKKNLVVLAQNAGGSRYQRRVWKYCQQHGVFPCSDVRNMRSQTQWCLILDHPWAKNVFMFLFADAQKSHELRIFKDGVLPLNTPDLISELAVEYTKLSWEKFAHELCFDDIRSGFAYELLKARHAGLFGTLGRKLGVYKERPVVNIQLP